MMVNEKVAAAFNKQIGIELFNSNQYVAVASYFEGLSLFGLSKLFFKQADEERGHAMRFVKYLLDVDAEVKVPEVPAPKGGFKSAEEAVVAALDLEKKTTSEINDLVTLTIDEKDYASHNFLQWFVNEQVEEVSSAKTRVDVVRRAGPTGLMMVEAYLAHGSE